MPFYIYVYASINVNMLITTKAVKGAQLSEWCFLWSSNFLATFFPTKPVGGVKETNLNQNKKGNPHFLVWKRTVFTL